MGPPGATAFPHRALRPAGSRAAAVCAQADAEIDSTLPGAGRIVTDAPVICAAFAITASFRSSERLPVSWPAG